MVNGQPPLPSQKKQLTPLYIFISESVELSLYSCIVGLDVEIQWSELFLLRVICTPQCDHIELSSKTNVLKQLQTVWEVSKYLKGNRLLKLLCSYWLFLHVRTSLLKLFCCVEPSVLWCYNTVAIEKDGHVVPRGGHSCVGTNGYVRLTWISFSAFYEQEGCTKMGISELEGFLKRWSDEPMGPRVWSTDY